MKNFFLLTSAIILCIACQNKPQRYFSESPEIETVKAGIKAYETGDWSKWKSNFSDTAKIYVNSLKSLTVKDRLEGLKQMTSAMSSYGFDHDKEFIEMVLDKEDETWVYYWATHKGTLAANNKEMSIPVHLAIHFEKGKIVEEHIYFDGTEMNAEFQKLNDKEEEEELLEN
ncbi:ester cyclase [Tamlana sp. 2201CG12-4]|uniref:nuclear transport factor 2 family protein n=1 Tax=Tamlana sp. 2201CG12-4 TaxID=3112582 RepID=UPI002DB99E9B|nr:ester cyclase [Tamlana sp. 2201CG12-4]MEC3908184.1 ester cyclase [Tamlana sp. 2201CG12-4]